MTEEIDNANKKRVRSKWIISSVILICVVGFLSWLLIFRDTSPADVNSQAAQAARQEALTEAGITQVETLDGIWVVDTEIGTFDQSCLTTVCNSSFIGFRIDEELVGIGGKTVVGRTSGVVAQFAIEGTSIFLTGDEENPTIVVDMAGLTTDDAGRNNAIRMQAIETSAYPEASFNIVESIDFSSAIDLETGFEIEVSGDLTIHAVTRQEQIVLNVSFNGSRILVYGELTPILLDNYEIEKPRSAVVLSVDDKATMEFQLYFKKLN